MATIRCNAKIAPHAQQNVDEGQRIVFTIGLLISKFGHGLVFSLRGGINPHSLSSTARFGLLDLTNEIAGPFRFRRIALRSIAKHTDSAPDAYPTYRLPTYRREEFLLDERVFC
jgi:hypothetical protein